VSTVNEASVNFFKDELLNKDAGYVASIGSDGSLALTIKASAAGVKAGDTVKVTVDGVAFTMPVAADAASAVKGQNALIISGDTLTVSLVGGDFATANKIAAKTVTENGAVQWYYTEATAVPAVVSISK
jgi:hypothetical protein